MLDDLKALLGIDGRVLATITGNWYARIINAPCRSPDNDRIQYDLEFARVDDASAVRRLHLDTVLTISVDHGAEKVVAWIAAFWLAGDERAGTYTCFPQPRYYRDDPAIVLVDGTRVQVDLPQN
jgi:hypothetical protein